MCIRPRACHHQVPCKPTHHTIPDAGVEAKARRGEQTEKGSRLGTRGNLTTPSSDGEKLNMKTTVLTITPGLGILVTEMDLSCG